MKRRLFSSKFLKKSLLLSLLILISFFTLGIEKSEAKIRFSESQLFVGGNTNTIYIISSDQITEQTEIITTSPTTGGSVTSSDNKKILPVEKDWEIRHAAQDVVLSDIKTLRNNLTEKTTSYLETIKDLDSTNISYFQKLFDNADSLLNESSVLSYYNTLIEVDETYSTGRLDVILNKMISLYFYSQIEKIKNKETIISPENEKVKALLNNIEKDWINRSILSSSDEGLTNKEKQDGAYLLGRTLFTPPVSEGSENNTGTPEDFEIDELGNVNILGGSSVLPKTCTATTFWRVLMDNTGDCSVVAFMVNSLFSLLTKAVSIIIGLVGALFDWILSFSVYNFKALVSGSGIFLVWKNITLALITSLILPIVLYLIIRMLIDNDSTQIKKILPRVLFTALFVYFSFSVVGWIIDQSNLVTLYFINSRGTETIAEGMQKLLRTDTISAVDKTLGNVEAIPFHAVKVILAIVGLGIIFQAVILFFLRAIKFILVLTFSPIMLLPTGISGHIDTYREMVTKNFVNALISAPIFMILYSVAREIAETSQNFLDQDATLRSLGDTSIEMTSSVGTGFMAATISIIIAIIILQLAITTAKKMSGDLGKTISGKLSSLAGGVALGGTAAVLRTGTNKVAGSEKVQGWMERNKDNRVGRLSSSLLKSAQDSTFDARNTGAFKAVSKISLGTTEPVGTGSQTTARDRLNQAYEKERVKYDALNTREEKDKFIEELRSPTSRTFYGKEIAQRLEKENIKTTTSFKEKYKKEEEFKEKFDKINDVNNEKMRDELIKDMTDDHFNKEGYGKKFFSKAIEEEEFIDIKNSYNEALLKKDNQERRELMLKTLDDFEKRAIQGEKDKNNEQNISNHQDKREKDEAINETKESLGEGKTESQKAKLVRDDEKENELTDEEIKEKGERLTRLQSELEERKRETEKKIKKEESSGISRQEMRTTLIKEMEDLNNKSKELQKEQDKISEAYKDIVSKETEKKKEIQNQLLELNNSIKGLDLSLKSRYARGDYRSSVTLSQEKELKEKQELRDDLKKELNSMKTIISNEIHKDKPVEIKVKSVEDLSKTNDLKKSTENTIEALKKYEEAIKESTRKTKSATREMESFTEALIHNRSPLLRKLRKKGGNGDKTPV